MPSRLTGKHVVATLNRLVSQRGAPSSILVNNGSEFTGVLLDLWSYHNKCSLDFSRPGTPTDNISKLEKQEQVDAALPKISFR